MMLKVTSCTAGECIMKPRASFECTSDPGKVF